MTDKVLVLTTVGSEEEAMKIAHALVERQVAACVNVIPKVRSIYRWEGKVEDSEEWLLLIKTDKAHIDEVRGVVRGLHSYTLPEFIAVAIEAGSEEYLRWMEASLATSHEQ